MISGVCMCASVCDMCRVTHLEISEEGVYQEVQDDERGEDGIDDRHEDETALKAVLAEMY